MPEKMNFNEEGGVTLGLDGTKFYAVIYFFIHFIIIFIINY